MATPFVLISFFLDDATTVVGALLLCSGESVSTVCFSVVSNDDLVLTEDVSVADDDVTGGVSDDDDDVDGDVSEDEVFDKFFVGVVSGVNRPGIISVKITHISFVLKKSKHSMYT